MHAVLSATGTSCCLLVSWGEQDQDEREKDNETLMPCSNHAELSEAAAQTRIRKLLAYLVGPDNSWCPFSAV